jgi:hypothetical protein
LLKQIDNLNKLNESLFLNSSLIIAWLTKTDKSFKDMSFEDVKKNKHGIIKMFNESNND